ncbi:MAG: endolytic transglycosylase MltG, partial [Rhodospirillaceae bacterium]|nr:endolytic transglycosylase MltG [Rhodospirillaceae bacterium]
KMFGEPKPLRAGEYAFPAALSPAEAARILQSGRTVQRRVTFAEGLTRAEVASTLAAAAGATGAVGPLPQEGWLLPETYHYAFGDSREALLKRMNDAMVALADKLWSERAPDLPIKSVHEAVILASIVEKETGVASERPRVAAVFINRLRLGMRLQSDPTVVYGLTFGEKPLGHGLTRADLQSRTPYNTYLIKGLPPTAIANPGRAALESVLHPADSKDLYFVADGTGGHAFARTLKGHNANVAKWRRIERARKKKSN